MSAAGTQENFIASSGVALHDPNLRSALGKAQKGFVDKRADAIAAVDDFEAMRDTAQAIRKKALSRLDDYLLQFETNVQAAGGHVHWAESPADMRRIVLDICAENSAQYVTKGKSMVSEEVGLNAAMEDQLVTVFGFDLCAVHPRANMLNRVEYIDSGIDQTLNKRFRCTIGVEKHFGTVGVNHVAPLFQARKQKLFERGGRHQ